MTGGTSPIGYLKAWHTNLYLSADADKVREALAEGEAALDTDVLIRFLFFFKERFKFCSSLLRCH